MNRLSRRRRCEVVRCLIEGSGVRPTARITGVSKNTVQRLTLNLGAVCERFSDRTLRDLPCAEIQVDEAWCFINKKQRRVPEEQRDDPEQGDLWTWVAIDPHSKLVPCYRIGPRDGAEARAFLTDLARRLRGRIQLTSDGHRPYVDAVEHAFGGQVDFAMLVKEYESDAVQQMPERRYSPGQFVTCHKVPVVGNPADEKIGTSYIESQNLTIRMRMRRYTRLTNGFSKSLRHHRAAGTLHMFDRNFIRFHETLGRPPALAAGVVDRVMRVDELVEMLEQREARERRQRQAA